MLPFFLFLHLLFSFTSAVNSAAYTPTDYILLDCGAPSSSSLVSEDGREWTTDEGSKFATSNSENASSNFRATSAYLALSAEDGQPASLIKEFMVPCFGTEKLIVTFSPSPNSLAFVNGIEVVSMPKELYVKHQEDSVSFVNSKIPFDIPDATAFETVYRLNVGGKTVANVDDTGMFRTWRDDSTYIFEGASGNVPSRSNISINYTDIPAYTAPAIVYTTSRTMGREPHINENYNLTWNFQIDGGFGYLLRLHFCETQLEVTKEGQRIFDIFINNQTAEHDADVIHWSGGNSIPVYKDYVLYTPSEGHSKQTLWLALHPTKPARYQDAMLNGVEIFRLNHSDGSLAVPNPEPSLSVSPPLPRAPKKKKGCSLVMIITIAVFSGVFALSLIICVFIYKHKVRRVKDSAVSEPKSSWAQLPCPSNSTCATSVSLLPSDLCRRFSIVEIKEATLNFDEQFIIGSGGFGHVYKGCIDGGSTTVAIKRLDSSSRQGIREFQTELELLSKLRHVNLVSLIGFCDDLGEMILVYEYMARGTLRDHLYKTKNPPLSWKRRLEICIGAARGLQYLHAGVKQAIIHRDIKSTNILLDENWVAKVSDFGLSRLGPTDIFQSHVSTVVKGSVGYVDPEYYRKQQLTEKSDVYSFGVVLFEVLCARPAMIPGLPKDQISLARWAKICLKRGSLESIVDPNLMGDISPLCLKKFGELAESCIKDEGIERPIMNEVVWGLEFALQVQESGNMNIVFMEGGDEVMKSCSSQTSPLKPGRGGGGTTTDDDNEELFSVSGGKASESGSTISSVGRSITRGDLDRIKSESVFSEITNAKGR
ncbi:hypothetical protein ERO13_D11G164800v2 [Gossypium hirsutum]|uniref:Receptor-like protein kinase FERONIA n=3 Tax=Gossypium TaxID=3633 RepID=A0A1U8K767_GOSHI|nr:receptor-like protein kinase FERONIA [Gossypium hirsutum]KAB2004068.1 hypothetical protein ES319_D11G172600v1 [Gossypium barbadense]KAG4120777.1 hypothetical protein ERO13_D11G164800v2 [Gossypium hirsutum]TYG45539.1 hypothetical protein ES288_D11G182500v1 [Gossypium darwinii]